LCKLYELARDKKIVCKHFTAHKYLYDVISDIYNLLDNIEVEFVDNKDKKAVYVTGSYAFLKKEKMKYNINVNYYPEFICADINMFNLSNDYVVVQLESGIKNNTKRSFDINIYNRLIKNNNVVLLGTDNIKVANSKNVIDLRCRTTVVEAATIIKNAKHFYGCQGLLCFIALSQQINSSICVRGATDRQAIKYRIENTPEWKKYYKEI
jgi:hypothetical protein